MNSHKSQYRFTVQDRKRR